MARQWRKLQADERCGQCGAELPRGTSVMIITLPNVKRPRIRCEDCAGPAPPDLPAVIEHKTNADILARGFTRIDATAERFADRWSPHKND